MLNSARIVDYRDVKTEEGYPSDMVIVRGICTDEKYFFVLLSCVFAALYVSEQIRIKRTT